MYAKLLDAASCETALLLAVVAEVTMNVPKVSCLATWMRVV